MVDHKLLLSKLEAKKPNRTLVQWFQYYLTDRTQFLTLKGQSSSCRAITAGVAGGSILGPLLFVLFIIDLHLQDKTRIDMFADDTILLASSDFANVRELENTLSLGVSTVYE